MESGSTFCTRDNVSEINSRVLSLDSLEKTLIIPLWARAEETLHGGLINDELSVKFIEQIDTSVFGFDQMSSFVRNYLLTAIANRTLLIDSYLDTLVNENSIVYNFGCGLDTRFERYKSKVLKWVDIDLPEVIELRKELVTESSGYSMMCASILDDKFNFIEDSEDNIIICEGLLMYFKGSEVQNFLGNVIDTTKSGNMILESLGSWAKIKINPVIKGIGENSRYTWTLNNTQDYRKLDIRMKLINSKNIFKISNARWGTMGKLMKSKYLNDRVSSKITLYRF